MAYDQGLAERIREVIGGRAGVTEKEMFGGVAFLLDGKMFVGIIKDDLMARVGPERHEASLREAHVRPMDFAGRPMKGYVYVAPPGIESDEALATWVEICAAHAATLPAKAPPKPKAKAKAQPKKPLKQKR